MSELRKQIQMARAEYRSLRYHGHLAAVVLPPLTLRSQWRIGRIVAAAGLMAACMAVVILSPVAPKRNAAAPSLVADARLGMQRVTAIVPTPKDARGIMTNGNMAQAVAAATPPKVSEWLTAVKEPVVTSGRYIVSLGKDLAHLADALFEMG